MGRRFRIGVVSVLLVCLAACVSAPTKGTAANGGATGQKSASPAATSPDSTQAAKDANGVDAAISAHIQKAIGELHVGRVAVAKAELAAVIQQDPGHIQARGLLAQINTDPVRYFGGPEAFNYTLQPGDTLDSVAQRFLDEPLKFFILARFNGVNDPSKLTAGKTIKVPGRRDAEPVAAAPRDESRAQRARRLYDAGKYAQVIETLEGTPESTNGERDLLTLAYGKDADELLARGDFDAAQAQVQKALVLRPEREVFRAQLKHIEKQRNIATSYKAGMYALEVGDNAKALDSFNAVLKVDPNHEDAKKQIARLRSEAVEGMHRDALVEYNKQNLDKAIELWDRVLDLLPTHQTARLYRTRAIDLRTRLQQLQ